MTGAVYMGIMTLVSLVLNMRRRDRYAALLLFRSLVYLIKCRVLRLTLVDNTRVIAAVNVVLP